MSLNVFERHNIDRNFDGTGQIVVCITPGRSFCLLRFNDKQAAHNAFTLVQNFSPLFNTEKTSFVSEMRRCLSYLVVVTF